MKIEPSGPVVLPLAPAAAGWQSVAALRPVAPLKAVAAVAGEHAPASACAQLASTSGDFDAAKVVAIRQSISAGLYQVNLGKVADGLLASVHELLSGPRP